MPKRNFELCPHLLLCVIFSVCSHPWKPQYAWFSVKTFVLVTSCSVSVSRLYERHKKIPQKTFMFCCILIQKPFSNTYLTRFIFPVVKNMFKVIKITLLEATFFITLNVLMTVALSSLKIGRTSCFQPEKIIKK